MTNLNEAMSPEEKRLLEDIRQGYQPTNEALPNQLPPEAEADQQMGKTPLDDQIEQAKGDNA